MENLIIDPLVSDCQWLPAVLPAPARSGPDAAICLGSRAPDLRRISNVSNAVPNDNRPLINRVYLAMLMGVGLQMMIANPFDEKQNDVIRWIETKDTSNPLAAVYNKIADRTSVSVEEPSAGRLSTVRP